MTKAKITGSDRGALSVEVTLTSGVAATVFVEWDGRSDWRVDHGYVIDSVLLDDEHDTDEARAEAASAVEASGILDDWREEARDEARLHAAGL